jgi:hypothetical protein
MKHISLTGRTWLLTGFLFIAFGLIPRPVTGASTKIALPPALGGILGVPGQIAFAHQGAVALVAVAPVSAPAHLVSLTVSDAAIADDLVLDEFPPLPPFDAAVYHMTVDEPSGLIAIAGRGPNESQTIATISVDTQGKLSRRWAVNPANPNGRLAAAAFNADGSVVYALYNDSTPKLDKLRAEDGAVLGTIQLDDVDIDAGLMFDPVFKRLVVQTSSSLHVLKPEPDFTIDWSVPTSIKSGSDGPLFISADGRFLIGYGGYTINRSKANNANVFTTLDLATSETRVLTLKGRLLPSGVALTFAPNIAAVIVPYSWKAKVKGERISICSCGSQVADWLSLGQDGALTREVTTQLTGDQQVIGPLNNAAFSRTSAIAFLGTQTNRLVGIDTLTGEVVSDRDVGSVYFIYRIGATDTFLTTNGTNVLNLLDLNTGPSIQSVTLKKHKLIIEGENFLFGVRVQINGVDVIVEVARNPERPGREITAKIGKNEFFPGQELSVVVINRDGLSSDASVVVR